VSLPRLENNELSVHFKAPHQSVVKALYPYEASAPGELTITEDEVLQGFEVEDDWLLVQTESGGGKAGFVPASYVEEVCLLRSFIHTSAFFNALRRWKVTGLNPRLLLLLFPLTKLLSRHRYVRKRMRWHDSFDFNCH
jgi:hypothetical protein